MRVRSVPELRQLRHNARVRSPVAAAPQAGVDADRRRHVPRLGKRRLSDTAAPYGESSNCFLILGNRWRGRKQRIERMKLKHPQGWFAAGREVSRGIEVLSD